VRETEIREVHTLMSGCVMKRSMMERVRIPKCYCSHLYYKKNNIMALVWLVMIV